MKSKPMNTRQSYQVVDSQRKHFYDFGMINKRGKSLIMVSQNELESDAIPSYSTLQDHSHWTNENHNFKVDPIRADLFFTVSQMVL